jgi:hypothetical protein
MTQINRYLSVWNVPYGVQLHQTDAYGHVNSITILNPEECQALGELLLLSGTPAVTEQPAVAAAVSTDWSNLTKAEIVSVVEELYDVTLDRDVSKATLVGIATKLEQESSK